MKKTLLIVLPPLITCIFLTVCVYFAVWGNLGNGNGGDEPDNLIHIHELTFVEEKQATCTENGNTAYYFCGECDKWFSDADGETEITDKESVKTYEVHNFLNGECQKCGAEHDCDYSSTVTLPTCTEAGFTTYECACGKSYIGNYKEPKHDYLNGKCRICGDEHDCKYMETVTEPTCTDRGYTAYTCTCGNGYKEKYTDTLGHEYVDGRCTRCGKLFGALEYEFYGSYYICTGIDSSFDIEDITELIIPSSYNGFPVKGIGNNALETCKNLTKVTIGEGITSIGNYAFRQCPIASITFPDSVESIGVYAFQDCTNLQSVTFSENLMSIGARAFYGCTSLTSIVIPDGVQTIGEAAFSFCNSLTSVTLGSGIKVINLWLFYECSSLTEVIIPDGVIIIYASAFSKCPILTSVTIPKSLIVIYRHAFSYTALSDIYYGGTVNEWLEINKDNQWDIETDDYTVHCTDGDYSQTHTVGLEYILSDDGAYYICSGIGTATAVDITIASKHYGKPVTAIKSGAFRKNERIKGVTVPDCLTVIGDGAFYGCSRLTSIKIGRGLITIERYAFTGCGRLEKITVSAENTKFHSKNNCLIETESKKLVVGCKNSIIPDDGSVTAIGGDAFYECDGLTSIIIPQRIVDIENYAFCRCDNLTSLTVDERNTKFHGSGNCIIETQSKTLIVGCKNSVIPDDGSVTAIGDCAFSASGLTEITIPEGVVSIGNHSFQACGDLTSVSIPDSVKEIGIYAFCSCYKLTSVIIPYGVMQLSEFLFENCSALESITIPNSVTFIDRFAFWRCSSLKVIDFNGTVAEWTAIKKKELWNEGMGSFVVHCTGVTHIGNYSEGLEFTLSEDETYYICSWIGSTTDTDIFIPSDYDGLPVKAIGERAFMHCGRVTGITIPDSVTSIGLAAFQNCTGLKKVVIPDSVTVIGNYAFYGCSSLVEITVPAGVTALESYTFTSCTKLERIIFKGTMDEWKAIPHTGWLYLNTCTIVCTDGQFKSGHI